MPKSLLGSLVIAHAELPPQALPKSMRPVVAAAKDLMSNPTPKTAAKLAEARLGTVVHPFGASAFRVKRIANVDGAITFAGETQDRRVVAHTVDPLTGFMPAWAVRLASITRLAAFDVSGMIREALTQHGLPTDDTNWDPLLFSIFRKAGVQVDRLDEAIQEAVYRAFYLRDGLGKFAPKEGPDAPPLVDQVRSWVIMLMEWQARGKWEAGGQTRTDIADASLDAPISGDAYSGEESSMTRADVLTEEDLGGTTITPESYAIRQSDVRSLTEFRELFAAYVNKYKPAQAAKLLVLLFDIIVMSNNGTEIMTKWSDATGTGYSYLRKTLQGLRDALVRFSDAKRAPDNQLSRIIQEVKNRALTIPNITPEMMGETSGPKAPITKEPEEEMGAPASNPAGDEDEAFLQSMKASSLQVLSADAFMAKLASAVLELKKQAAQVVDQSMLYIRMSAGKDPRFMELTFYSPSLRMGPGGGSYRIEVGDWSTDQGLNERKVKEGLSTFVVPQLRGDVLEDDHALLEKVIRKLKDLVWENAVAYFEVPLAQKPAWKNTVKLDIQTLLDHKVTVVDKNKAVTIAKWTRPAKPWVGGKAQRMAAGGDLYRDGQKVVPPVKQARSLGGEENLTPAEQTDFEPYPDKTAALSGDAFPDESRLPKGQMVAEIPAGAYSEGMPLYIYKAMTPRNARPYFLVKGFGPMTQMGPWLTEQQAQPYLAMDPMAKRADANDRRPDDPTPSPSAKTIGAQGFDPELHDTEAEPSITFMAEHLKANGVPDTAVNMQEAIAGFTEARDAHHKESSMSNKKFAGLKRVAAENPGAVVEAIKAIADKFQGMADNLKVMVENLQGGEEVHVEGDAAPAEPIPGQEGVTAAVQHIANEAPDQMEEALNELYGDTDEALALIENLADNLDIPLSVSPVEEEGEETETEEAPEQEDKSVAVGD